MTGLAGQDRDDTSGQRRCPDPGGSFGAAPEQQPDDLAERRDQVDRDTEEEGHRQLRQGEPDDDRDHVSDDDDQQVSRFLDLLAISVLRVEVLAPGARVQRSRQETDRQEGQPVERDSHPFGGYVVQVVRDKPGREGQERHHEQQDQVDLQEDWI